MDLEQLLSRSLLRRVLDRAEDGFLLLDLFLFLLYFFLSLLALEKLEGDSFHFSHRLFFLVGRGVLNLFFGELYDRLIDRLSYLFLLLLFLALLH